MAAEELMENYGKSILNLFSKALHYYFVIAYHGTCVFFCCKSCNFLVIKLCFATGSLRDWYCVAL